jgi:hypothetical protein
VFSHAGEPVVELVLVEEWEAVGDFAVEGSPELVERELLATDDGLGRNLSETTITKSSLSSRIGGIRAAWARATDGKNRCGIHCLATSGVKVRTQ